jgi:hypothetical protein
VSRNERTGGELVTAWAPMLALGVAAIGCGGNSSPPAPTPPPRPTATASPAPVVTVPDVVASSVLLPDVVGISAFTARAILLTAGFDVQRATIADRRCEFIGHVKAQSPSGGTVAPTFSSVTIRVGVRPSTGCRSAHSGSSR